MQYRHGRRDSFRFAEESENDCGGAVLSGRGGLGSTQEQRAFALEERADGDVAASAAYARIWQPDHECAALPATGVAWVSGQRDGTRRLGALNEKRIDHRAVQGSAARQTGAASVRCARNARSGRDARAVLHDLTLWLGLGLDPGVTFHVFEPAGVAETA